MNNKSISKFNLPLITNPSLCKMVKLSLIAISISLLLLNSSSHIFNAYAKGGSAVGGPATGSGAIGGAATGGNADGPGSTGGAATGGTGTGNGAEGGDAKGGPAGPGATGGVAIGGNETIPDGSNSQVGNSSTSPHSPF